LLIYLGLGDVDLDDGHGRGVARELRLKLTGDALLAYNQGFTPDASPTFEEVAAQLAKAFI
jgi:hypothetical protein